jgi:hypothetical protein
MGIHSYRLTGANKELSLRNAFFCNDAKGCKISFWAKTQDLVSFNVYNNGAPVKSYGSTSNKLGTNEWKHYIINGLSDGLSNEIKDFSFKTPNGETGTLWIDDVQIIGSIIPQFYSYTDTNNVKNYVVYCEKDSPSDGCTSYSGSIPNPYPNTFSFFQEWGNGNTAKYSHVFWDTLTQSDLAQVQTDFYYGKKSIAYFDGAKWEWLDAMNSAFAIKTADGSDVISNSVDWYQCNNNFIVPPKISSLGSTLLFNPVGTAPTVAIATGEGPSYALGDAVSATFIPADDFTNGLTVAPAAGIGGSTGGQGGIGGGTPYEIPNFDINKNEYLSSRFICSNHDSLNIFTECCGYSLEQCKNPIQNKIRRTGNVLSSIWEFPYQANNQNYALLFGLPWSSKLDYNLPLITDYADNPIYNWSGYEYLEFFIAYAVKPNLSNSADNFYLRLVVLDEVPAVKQISEYLTGTGECIANSPCVASILIDKNVIVNQDEAQKWLHVKIPISSWNRKNIQHISIYANKDDVSQAFEVYHSKLNDLEKGTINRFRNIFAIDRIFLSNDCPIREKMDGIDEKVCEISCNQPSICCPSGYSYDINQKRCIKGTEKLDPICPNPDYLPDSKIGHNIGIGVDSGMDPINYPDSRYLFNPVTNKCEFGTRYCAAFPEGTNGLGYMWVNNADYESKDIATLPMGRVICDSTPGWKWTGTTCCGDDVKIQNDDGTPLTTPRIAESFTDTLGGCIRGRPVMNNTVMNVSKTKTDSSAMFSALFLDKTKFVLCKADGTKTPWTNTISELGGSLSITITEGACIPKADWFCDMDNQWKNNKQISGEIIGKNISNLADNHYLPDKTTQGCCPINWCYVGHLNGSDAPGYNYGCIPDQSNQFSMTGAGRAFFFNNSLIYGSSVAEKTGDGISYRCIRGAWQEANLKWNPDHTAQGFCDASNKCYFENSCVNSGFYNMDDYCQDGSWTTRTKQIALGLASIAPSSDFTIYCDAYNSVLNEYSYILPDGATNVNKIIRGDSDSAGVTDTCAGKSGPCTNNFCVLRYTSGGSEHVVVGTSLNIPVNTMSKEYSFLRLFNEAESASTTHHDYCDQAIIDSNALVPNGYKACKGRTASDSTGKILYNNKTQSIIYSKDTEINAVSLTTTPSINWWQNLINSIKTLFGIPSEESSYNFVDEISDFNKIYYSTSSSGTITGVVEKVGEEEAMTVHYSITGYNLCTDPSVKELLNILTFYINECQQNKYLTKDSTIISTYWNELTTRTRLS